MRRHPELSARLRRGPLQAHPPMVFQLDFPRQKPLKQILTHGISQHHTGKRLWPWPMNVFCLRDWPGRPGSINTVLFAMLKSKSKVKRGGPTSAGRKLKKYDRQAKKAPYIVVGYPKSEIGSIKYPDGTAVIFVAVKNEFGIGIPERSFLRSTLIQKRKEYRRMIAKASENAIRGRKPLDKSLNRIGMIAVADIQRKITELRTPPNAPSTIRIKKSSNPLIDTGLMRLSTTYALRHGRNGKINEK